MSTNVVVAVASAKGGVGKTTTSVNLAAALAAAGYSVVVVEGDIAMANIVDLLDLDLDLDEDPTLHDVLAGAATVGEVVYGAPGGFDVAPSGTALEGFAATDPAALADAVRALRGDYDVVVLDTGAGLSHETVLPLGLADATVLISTPRVASVRDTKKTKEVVERVGGTVVGLVFVRSGTERTPEVDHIAEALSVELLGHVPEDAAVPAAQDAGRPVVASETTSPAAEAYVDIAERLVELVDGFADAGPDGSPDGSGE